MSCLEGLSVWTEIVSSHMARLTKPQAVVPATWSYGIALTRSCGRDTVAVFLAMVLKQKASTLEQRLREWYYEAQHKRGKQRRELDVATCFVPLMQWIVSLWTTTAIALALDATAALMTAFYRGYLKLDDKALALQQAMRELRSKPDYEHLRYWAPLWSAPRLDKYYKRPCHSEKGHTVRRYGPSQAG